MKPLCGNVLQQLRDTLCLAIRSAHYLHTLQQENRTLNALYEIGRLCAISSSTEDAAKGSRLWWQTCCPHHLSPSTFAMPILALFRWLPQWENLFA
jgi:hypothetical protein